MKGATKHIVTGALLNLPTYIFFIYVAIHLGEPARSPSDFIAPTLLILVYFCFTTLLVAFLISFLKNPIVKIVIYSLFVFIPLWVIFHLAS